MKSLASNKKDTISPSSRRSGNKRTYAPPHIIDRPAFSESEDDDEPSQPPVARDSAQKVAATGEGGDSGTPGVDRPPETLFFKTKKNKNRDAAAAPAAPARASAPATLDINDNSIVQSRDSSYQSRGGHHRQDDDTNDSVTIDSYLKATANRQQQRIEQRQRERQERKLRSERARGVRRTHSDETGDGTSASVYHLAHEGVRAPSPKHRRKLDAWYENHQFEEEEEQEEFDDEDEEYLRNSNNNNGRRRRTSRGVGRRHRVNSAASGGGGVLSSWLSSGGGGKTTSEESEYDEDHGHSDADDATVPSGVFRVGSLELSADGMVSSASFFHETVFGEDEYLRTKQETAYLSIFLTSIQLLVLCLQLAMCGIATFEMNPFVGPYPDAFSEWGGKNAYLMIQDNQWWRLVSPSLLHVGVLHLLANAFCQLEPIALFEREWGSMRWMILYLLSSIGCVSVSSLVDPNTIAVGSSGALMGLFAAKLAQVTSHLIFEVNKANQDDMIRLDQLSSVICGLILVSLLSFFTYIDWSGHMGGLVVGFFGGMLFFCNPIRSCCWKFLWGLTGLCGVAGSLAYVFYEIFYEAEAADDDLGNVCEYFRYFFPEGYECGCLW